MWLSNTAHGERLPKKMGKVSAGNSGQRLTPDTQYISAMNKSFGLKLEVVKHLPLGYLQTKVIAMQATDLY